MTNKSIDSMFDVKVIAHSIGYLETPIVTVAATYPNLIHQELLTHRAFSRNSSSSRAIPVAKMLQSVLDNPGMPVYWGLNRAGMQAAEEPTQDLIDKGKEIWLRLVREAAAGSKELSDLGFHKQVANRPLDSYRLVSTIITSTDWDNFFELRIHKDADPTIRHLALEIRNAIKASTPRYIAQSYSVRSCADSWHLPFISDEEKSAYYENALLLAKVSSARCARTTYNNHDNSAPDIEKDLSLFDRLVGSKPYHASAVEHCAYPSENPCQSNNFRNWIQFRKHLALDEQ